MVNTRRVVLIRAAQLIVSVALAVIAVDLIIGILRPETRGVVKLEQAALIALGFTVVALAASAAVRWTQTNRHRRL